MSKISAVLAGLNVVNLLVGFGAGVVLGGKLRAGAKAVLLYAASKL